jgi:hypothetical protein
VEWPGVLSPLPWHIMLNLLVRLILGASPGSTLQLLALGAVSV